MRRYRSLFDTMGIVQTFNETSYEKLLEDIFQKYHGEVLDDNDVDVVLAIINARSRMKELNIYYMLTESRKLINIENTFIKPVYEDFLDGLSTDGLEAVHPEIPQVIGKDLGILKKSQVLSSHIGDNIFENVNYRAELIDVIKGALTGYDTQSLFFEMIQNADDAGANYINLIYDRCKYSHKKTLDGHDQVLNPSLCVFNNAKFTESDFEAISKIHQRSKEAKIGKIGKFGIGFTSVYNITDTPWFVSGEWVYMFDPLGKVSNIKGKKFQFLSDRCQRFTGQWEPFKSDDFNEMKSPFEGTYFRFPIRKEKSPFGKRIKDKMVKKLLMFSLEYYETILCLRNVNEIVVSGKRVDCDVNFWSVRKNLVSETGNIRQYELVLETREFGLSKSYYTVCEVGNISNMGSVFLNDDVNSDCKPCQLYCFLPVLGLNKGPAIRGGINGCFKVSMDRKSIPLSKGEGTEYIWNQKTIGYCCKAYKEILGFKLGLVMNGDLDIQDYYNYFPQNPPGTQLSIYLSFNKVFYTDTKNDFMLIDQFGEPVSSTSCYVVSCQYYLPWMGKLDYHVVQLSEKNMFLKFEYGMKELRNADMLKKLEEKLNRDSPVVAAVPGFNKDDLISIFEYFNKKNLIKSLSHCNFMILETGNIGKPINVCYAEMNETTTILMEYHMDDIVDISAYPQIIFENQNFIKMFSPMYLCSNLTKFMDKNMLHYNFQGIVWQQLFWEFTERNIYLLKVEKNLRFIPVRKNGFINWVSVESLSSVYCGENSNIFENLNIPVIESYVSELVKGLCISPENITNVINLCKNNIQGISEAVNKDYNLALQLQAYFEERKSEMSPSHHNSLKKFPIFLFVNGDLKPIGSKGIRLSDSSLNNFVKTHDSVILKEQPLLWLGEELKLKNIVTEFILSEENWVMLLSNPDEMLIFLSYLANNTKLMKKCSTKLANMRCIPVNGTFMFPYDLYNDELPIIRIMKNEINFETADEEWKEFFSLYFEGKKLDSKKLLLVSDFIGTVDLLDEEYEQIIEYIFDNIQSDYQQELSTKEIIKDHNQYRAISDYVSEEYFYLVEHHLPRLPQFINQVFEQYCRNIDASDVICSIISEIRKGVPPNNMTRIKQIQFLEKNSKNLLYEDLADLEIYPIHGRYVKFSQLVLDYSFEPYYYKAQENTPKLMKLMRVKKTNQIVLNNILQQVYDSQYMDNEDAIYENGHKNLILKCLECAKKYGIGEHIQYLPVGDDYILHDRHGVVYNNDRFLWYHIGSHTSFYQLSANIDSLAFNVKCLSRVVHPEAEVQDVTNYNFMTDKINNALFTDALIRIRAASDSVGIKQLPEITVKYAQISVKYMYEGKVLSDSKKKFYIDRENSIIYITPSGESRIFLANALSEYYDISEELLLFRLLNCEEENIETLLDEEKIYVSNKNERYLLLVGKISHPCQFENTVYFDYSEGEIIGYMDFLGYLKMGVIQKLDDGDHVIPSYKVISGQSGVSECFSVLLLYKLIREDRNVVEQSRDFGLGSDIELCIDYVKTLGFFEQNLVIRRLNTAYGTDIDINPSLSVLPKEILEIVLRSCPDESVFYLSYTCRALEQVIDLKPARIALLKAKRKEEKIQVSNVTNHQAVHVNHINHQVFNHGHNTYNLPITPMLHENYTVHQEHVNHGHFYGFNQEHVDHGHFYGFNPPPQCRHCPLHC
eukprot:TRINITY_DN9408_c0_g1_i1.p1 TRINITY_DN9408_c0_g1~~TRINITY_DN9408_c0_g1_i1.p1  ORF type:complete len:1945 (+),score=346.01 TRINITY_DN9408_c0_g1_i1:793-5835(+)